MSINYYNFKIPYLSFKKKKNLSLLVQKKERKKKGICTNKDRLFF